MNYNDNINHPTHYETGKFECIEVMLEPKAERQCRTSVSVTLSSIFTGTKNKNADEDIKKAIWYLNKYLELRSDWSDGEGISESGKGT